MRAMIEQWAQTAAQVERGYPLTFDDYLNDLDLRRLIDESLRYREDAREGSGKDSSEDAMPPSLSNALAAADEQFRQATVESAENVWGAENAQEEGWGAVREWWYYRRPEPLPKSW